MTGETITDPDALRAQLADIRATGIATEVEEAVLGECELAAPVGDRLGAPAGAHRPRRPGDRLAAGQPGRRRVAHRGTLGLA